MSEIEAFLILVVILVSAVIMFIGLCYVGEWMMQ